MEMGGLGKRRRKPEKVTSNEAPDGMIRAGAGVGGGAVALTGLGANGWSDLHRFSGAGRKPRSKLQGAMIPGGEG